MSNIENFIKDDPTTPDVGSLIISLTWGESCMPGEAGVVVHRHQEDILPIVAIFENGGIAHIMPDEFDCQLQHLHQHCNNLNSYQYRGRFVVEKDFESGLFTEALSMARSASIDFIITDDPIRIQ